MMSHFGSQRFRNWRSQPPVSSEFNAAIQLLVNMRNIRSSSFTADQSLHRQNAESSLKKQFQSSQTSLP
jgi:hypothetical protein